MPDPDAASGRVRPFALVGLAVTGVLIGAVFGAVTNAVNGRVSPTYFVNVLGWDDVSDVGRAAIAQGILEGVLFGLFFAAVFTTVVGIASRARCPYGRGLKYLFGLVLAALVAWVLGGLVGMGLASLSPEWYRETFEGVPADPAKMRGYAWVGGSIVGAIWGGLVAVALASVLFAVRWRRGLFLGPDAG